MRVFHIITGLNNGGAEGVLYRLCKHDAENQHLVVSMMDEGKYGPLLNKEGVEVHCLNMQQGSVSFSGLWKLFRLLRAFKPDVVQTWMYHADLIGGVIARISGIKYIFWNVRHTNLEPGTVKKKTIWVAKICSFISSFLPYRILYCANDAKFVHERLGYEVDKGVVVRNGYNLSEYNFDVHSCERFRSEINLLPEEILLGMVGRYNPQKDHNNLISALGIIKKKGVKFKVALVGKGVDYSNTDLFQCISANDLENEIVLLEQRTDIPAVMNGMDLHILSSLSEAFPNVLAEAMACCTPCVTTNVGDASFIVGETGWVVEPRNPEQVAQAIEAAMLEKQNNPEQWDKRKQDCRVRIVDNFSIDTMVKNYNQVWNIK